MSDSIASVYSEARSEYTKQLCTYLVPAYFKFFLGQLDRAREMSTGEPRKFLWHFQSLLNEVPDWNMDKVNNEIAKIQAASGCDYLEDLLTAVFIAHTKVLTAIRINSKQKKVQITVPKVEHFLFKALCESAKLLWGSTFLFRENATSVERQQNYRTIEGLLAEGITQAVRAMVPVKSILKDFMSIGGGDAEDEEGDADDDGEDDEEKLPETPATAPVATPAATASVTPATASVTPATAPANANTVIEPPAEVPEAPADVPVSNNVQTVLDALAELLPSVLAPVAEPTPATPVTPATHVATIGTGTAVPTIIVDTRGPSVGFTDFDAILDSDDPEGSNIIYEPKEGKGEEGSDDDEGLLEILDEEGRPLEAGDMEDLDAPAPPSRDDAVLQFIPGEVEEL